LEVEFTWTDEVQQFYPVAPAVYRHLMRAKPSLSKDQEQINFISNKDRNAKTALEFRRSQGLLRWVKHVQGQREKRDAKQVTYCRQHVFTGCAEKRQIACAPL
jgi:hypothetical protein